MKFINFILSKSINHIIGGNNSLLWNIKEDLLFFREMTINQTIIMGYKTFESIDLKPLSNRINIVITSKKLKSTNNNLIYTSDINQALSIANSLENNIIWIIGGLSLFEQIQYIKPNEICITDIDINIQLDKIINPIQLSTHFLEYIETNYSSELLKSNLFLDRKSNEYVKCNFIKYTKK